MYAVGSECSNGGVTERAVQTDGVRTEGIYGSYRTNIRLSESCFSA